MGKAHLARPTAAIGATALLSAGAIAATTGPASASASATLHATYKVSGSTYLAGTKSTLALGPGTLAASVNSSNDKLSATLSLPESTGSFTELGLPVTATAQFINDGPTTGKLNTKTGGVATTSDITLRLVSLTIDLPIPINIPVGKACETVQPVVVKLNSQKGFSVVNGGKLAGTYTIGDFAHCGLATILINGTIPASGNTITFTLGKAKIST
jgi:hypothetical protein